MSIKKISIKIALILLSGLWVQCQSFVDTKSSDMEAQPKVDRQPVVADRFYPGSKEELTQQLNNYFAEAQKLVNYNLFGSNDSLLAIISPHAGYVFSGIVSASAFQLLDGIKSRKRIFVIGSSHHVDFNGASVYNRGDYITPLGKLKVDTDLAEELIKSSSYITFDAKAHGSEHSLEVQLPFLQHIVGSDVTIVPIVIATQSNRACSEIAKILKPYLNKENLFIISTDFSHYPAYTDAVEVDKLTTNAIVTGKPDVFIDQLSINRKKNIPNLATSICGWTSVLTLLYITEGQEINYKPVLYRNSGDAKFYGDKERVVGYQSLAVYAEKKKTNQFVLTEKEKDQLLSLARATIKEYLWNGSRLEVNPTDYSPNLQTECGAFVSLYIDNDLRGCIGRIIGNETLLNIVRDMAISSAFFDNRFRPLSKEEFKDVRIEISVLTPLKEVNNISEIKLGKHGIYMKKGLASGTFLPQVADKTNWTLEEFLGHCARDKAGIGWDGWKEAELYAYEAIVFEEKK